MGAWRAVAAGVGLAGLISGVGASLAAEQDRRVALVVGNSRYVEAPLRNPVNDARAMATALRQRGFEVLLRENTNRRELETAIADFGEKLGEGATGLFFYAGHGMQVNGRNYLIPIDARITTEQRVKLETVDMDVVLDQMQAARSKVNMVILDACRNNPFERRFRSAGGGLAQINAPEGTLIAFATAPGKVAADGEGGNGLYTQELLRALGAPGLKVEDVFKQVRVNVSRLSQGAQTPWEASSLIGDFYFNPDVRPISPPLPNAEVVFWNTIKETTNPAELEAYLATYPAGEFVSLARIRLDALKRSRVTPTASQPSEVSPKLIQEKPVQQAMRPLATAPVLGPRRFEGQYHSSLFTVVGLNGFHRFVVKISIINGQISGIGEAAQDTSIYTGGACKVYGTMNPESGEILSMGMSCRNVEVSFRGRFREDNGTIVGETEARAVTDDRVIAVRWSPGAS